MKFNKSEFLKFFVILLSSWLLFVAIGHFAFPFLGYLIGVSPLAIATVLFLGLLIMLISSFMQSSRRRRSLIWMALTLSLFFAIPVEVMHYPALDGFHDGLIVKKNRSGVTYGLANKWGKMIIPSEYIRLYKCKDASDGKELILCLDVYIYDGNTDRNTDMLGMQMHVYKDYQLKSIVKFMESEEKTGQSLYTYIEQNYGQLLWDYSPDGEVNYNFLRTTYIDRFLEDTGSPATTSENYEDLGPIDCYSDFGVDPSDSDHYSAIYIGGYRLYAKNYNGENVFYIARGTTNDYHPLTRGSYKIKKERFNARTHGDRYDLYVNVPFWESSNNSSGSSGTIIIEHSGPRQEWVQCSGCYGSGKCQTCNGTGRNIYMTNYSECIGCGSSGRCQFCAGQGGHYETRY